MPLRLPWQRAKDSLARADEREDPRRAFRVTLPPHRPLIFRSFKGNFRVADLSAGGLAFRGGIVSKNSRILGYLDLEDGSPHLRVVAQVRVVRPDGLAGCEFLDLSDRDKERLHQFILNLQKEVMAAGPRPKG